MIKGEIFRGVSDLFTFFVKTRFQIEADISYVFVPTRKSIKIFLKFNYSLLKMPKIVEIG